MTDDAPVAATLIERGRAEAASARAAGLWSVADTVALKVRFEQAAEDALRAPVLVERSIVLRRVAKRIVPRRLRPMLRRLVVTLDAGSRAVDARRSARRARR